MLKYINKSLEQTINISIDFIAYTRDCLSKISTSLSTKSTRIRFSPAQALPVLDLEKYQIKETLMKSKWNVQSVVKTKAGMQKAEKLRPNAIFYFSNSLR